MKKFIVFDAATNTYLGSTPAYARAGGVPFNSARLFNSRNGAVQAGRRWKGMGNFLVKEVDVILPITTSSPMTFINTKGVEPVPFRLVIEYFLNVYSIDIEHSLAFKKGNALYSTPIVDYLEAHKPFLPKLRNGDKLVLQEKDFEHAHPSMQVFAREIIRVFGVPDDDGILFCLFVIDWKSS